MRTRRGRLPARSSLTLAIALVAPAPPLAAESPPPELAPPGAPVHWSELRFQGASWLGHLSVDLELSPPEPSAVQGEPGVRRRAVFRTRVDPRLLPRKSSETLKFARTASSAAANRLPVEQARVRLDETIGRFFTKAMGAF